MDQAKIGKFIAECRKKENLTQMQLAEKLGLTDRAISKWETGRAMPDSSVMLELCAILKITVNDLLNGEVGTMENYNKEMEGKLIDMIRQKEGHDKELFKLEGVIGILSLLVLMIPVFIGAFAPMEEGARLIVVFSGFIPGIIGFCFAVKIEQIAGYYECKHCHHRYVPTYGSVKMAMHMGRTRYMKCPNCQKSSWQKKVLKEKDE